MVECPKCGGGAFLAEEELVQILENTVPLQFLAKATYRCRACSQDFSRLILDLLDSRKKQAVDSALTFQPASSTPSATATPSSDGAEGIRFLDRV
jgi:DNA-directed RNA polymerase subunit RPC12/RpoP